MYTNHQLMNNMYYISKVVLKLQCNIILNIKY